MKCQNYFLGKIRKIFQKLPAVIFTQHVEPSSHTLRSQEYHCQNKLKMTLKNIIINQNWRKDYFAGVTTSPSGFNPLQTEK